MISERSVPRDVVFLVDVRAELPPEKPIRVVEERWIRQNESARPACLFEEGTLVALDDRRTQDSVRKGSAGLSHTLSWVRGRLSRDRVSGVGRTDTRAAAGCRATSSFGSRSTRGGVKPGRERQLEKNPPRPHPTNQKGWRAARL